MVASCQPASATKRAQEALERLVLEELGVGDSLPAEAELAASLSVSRLTIREAVKSLEARGLISVHRGRRATVRAPNGQLAGDFFRISTRRHPALLFELIELRRVLEVQIAEMAARKAGKAALAGMESSLGEMQELARQGALTTHDEECFHEADVRFHEALAAATGNSMLAMMIEELAEPLRASRKRTWSGRVRDGRPLGPVVDAHQAIFDKVVARDPGGAANAMRAHLDASERDLRSALQDV